MIGPKDMPLALRTAGRWIGKMRRLSGHFRSGLDAMIREAEMEDMESKWKAQNEKIMRQNPDSLPAEPEPTGALPPPPPPTPSPYLPAPGDSDTAAFDGAPAPSAAPAGAHGLQEQEPGAPESGSEAKGAEPGSGTASPTAASSGH